MDDGRGVVAGVHPLQRRDHGFTQVAFAVTPGHAGVDGVAEQAAADGDLLSQLHEDYGHARVLAQRELVRRSDAAVVGERFYGGETQGGSLVFCQTVQPGRHRLRQIKITLHAQTRYGVRDIATFDGAHFLSFGNRSPPAETSPRRYGRPLKTLTLIIYSAAYNVKQTEKRNHPRRL